MKEVEIKKSQKIIKSSTVNNSICVFNNNLATIKQYLIVQKEAKKNIKTYRIVKNKFFMSDFKCNKMLILATQQLNTQALNTKN
ncbi:MAG TPA: hypothetical protein PLW77_04885 [Bacteroidales bacterium]|nr:hypothetical protein [Bacteroidales bacterium]HQB22095.1 hypothetical protein [Bacteroidales bacterium]